MLARTDSRARALFLLIVVVLIATAIGGRLAWWHIVERDRLAEMAYQQLSQNQDIPADRGEIVDANGDLLAVSVQAQSVYARPPDVTDVESTAALLAPVLGVPVETLRDRLSSTAVWTWLSRRVSAEVADRVRTLDLDGIGMLPETLRMYPVAGVAPDTTLAAQVLGFVNVDGVGQYGIEGAENDLLAGLPGAVVAQEDVNGRQIADSVNLLRQPVDGSTLTLTLDAGLQHLLEASMWDTYQRNAAQGVTGIVMDVRTGAIRALATFPSFDANQYASVDPALFPEPAVAHQYEPGSVMKAFTVAAALDAGAITTKDTFHDDNNLQLAGVRIQNADRYSHPYGHGDITAAEVLQLSNNVGAAKIGLTLGRDRLYEAFRRFGFGSLTGVDISGETTGVVWNPDGPNGSGDLTAAQNAFGQGLSVTAVQLVAGYAAIANGGTQVTPHVVAGWTTPDGTFHPSDPAPGERVMREETAKTVLQLLTDAVDIGIAQPASIPGYSIAGKTGTAQIAGPVRENVQTGTDASGNPIYEWQTHYTYIDGWIDSSFISVMPASDPQLVTLILIHRPATWGRYQMAQTPTSVFKDLAPRILDYLAIPPDRPADQVAAK
jgi:stage V sporulation protein D (sporulation-specific penicillin-binding protein)